MNYSNLGYGIILLISFIILICIIKNYKNKSVENFAAATNHWWDSTETTPTGRIAYRSDIIRARGTPTCAANQYLEKGSSNLEKICYQSNKSDKFPTNNEIIYFTEDEFSKTEKTTDYNKKYHKDNDPLEDKILIKSKVTQKPSAYLKNNYGYTDLDYDNGYTTGQTPFNTIGDFLRYQTCKKYDENPNEKTHIPPVNRRIKAQIDKNETLGDFLNTGTIINKDTQQPYKCYNEKTDRNEDCQKGNMKRYKVDLNQPVSVQNNIKSEYHDLFGKAHKEQIDTNFLVSRGYGEIDLYFDDPSDEKLTANQNKFYNQFTTSICKECPVSTIQTYKFNLDKNPYLTQYDKDMRRGEYFVEKGGTFQNTRSGVTKCHLCSYQSGCYAPHAGRTDMFQIQSCSDGRDRKCMRCKKCIKGEEKLLKFCGEGGGSANTECTKCTPCKPDEYKVGGCDTFNSIEDNRCVKKTDCLGIPKKDDVYEDPGPGRRTYVTFDGYSGSVAGNVRDEYGKIIELKNPYFGKDRVCQICDDCPEGFKLLRGCQGRNNKENTVCQRVLNVDNYLDKDVRPPEGHFYNIEKVKNFMKVENLKIEKEDEKIRTKYMQKHRANPIKFPLTKINSPELFKAKPLPQITDEKLLEVGKQKCRVCPPGFYQDPNDPGCIGRTDTKCIPHTKCKNDGTETVKIPGTPTSDVVCGPCKCPEGLVGANPKCNGTTEVENCVKNIPCQDIKPGQDTPSAKKIIGTTGDKNEKIYTFDKPSAYGDSTKTDRCKVCEKKCPAGKFQLGDCDPHRSTDTVCQDHTKCDPETQIVVEPGTATKDTVCQCIDGYEWDKDSYGVEDRKKPCVEIKGKCHTDPCHPEAICYDNFDKDNKFLDFVCKCDLDKNFIETSDLGVGPNGCVKISDSHHHPVPDIDVNVLSAPQISDYMDLIDSKPSIVSNLAHTRGLNGTNLNGLFHAGLNTPHIHK